MSFEKLCQKRFGKQLNQTISFLRHEVSGRGLRSAMLLIDRVKQLLTLFPKTLGRAQCHLVLISCQRL